MTRRSAVRGGVVALLVSSSLLPVACEQTPSVQRQHVSMAWQDVGDSGRVLVVAVSSGDSCSRGRVTVRAVETGQGVRVSAVSHERVVGNCAGEGYVKKETLHLAAPLGIRRLTGCRWPVSDCRQAAADVPEWMPTPTPSPGASSSSSAAPSALSSASASS